MIGEQNQQNVDTENGGKRRAFPWLVIPAAVLCAGYVLIAVLVLTSADVLPADFVRSVPNFVLLGTIMLLPLCLTVIAGIMLKRTPFVSRTVKRMTKNGAVLWFRVDLPNDAARGESHETKKQ